MAKAKLRSVNTHFWTDSYIVELDPIEKLLFLYLLTNPLANIAGCYEIPLRQISFDTGIDREMVVKILARFEAARKIVYRDGWILLINFVKHQNLNENMRKGADALLSVAPAWVKKPFETLSNGSVKYEIESEVESEHKQNDPFASYPIRLFDLIKNYLGVVQLPNEPDWLGVADFAEVNGYTPEQVLECYKFLDSQEWRSGPVSPKAMQSNLPKFVKEMTAPVTPKFDLDLSGLYQ